MHGYSLHCTTISTALVDTPLNTINDERFIPFIPLKLPA